MMMYLALMAFMQATDQQPDRTSHDSLPSPILLAVSKTTSSKTRKFPDPPVAPSKADNSKVAPKIEEEEAIDDIETLEASELPSASNDVAEASNFYSDAFTIPDRLIDHYTARTLRAGDFATLIKHRNRQTFLIEPFRDGLGFDGGGLKIGLGLRYGIFSWLDVGLLRMNNSIEIYDTYEIDAKFQILKQEAFGFDLAVRAGASLFLYDFNPNNIASGFLGQVIGSYLIEDRCLLNALVMFHSNSSSPWKDNNNTAFWSLALGVGAEFRIVESFGIDAELTYGLSGFSLVVPTLLIAPKIFTNRHTFALTIANNQYFTADSLITNVYSWDPKTWTLGFQITREL